MILSTARKMNYNSIPIPFILVSIAMFAILSKEFAHSAPITSDENEVEDQAALESLLQPEEQAANDQEQAGSDLSGFLNESVDPEDSDSDSDAGDDDDMDQAAASNLIPESLLLKQQNQQVLTSSSSITKANMNQKPNNLIDYGRELLPAAGHHHHHKHYVSGKLEMGAESGKKGAFKWHDKHPVGGKGRR